MKSLLSISLLTIYLLGNTELNQVFDLPELVTHYKQHHAANHEINFLSFLVMHYCTDDGITTDDAQDSKLPFKQIHRVGFVFFTAPPQENCVEQESDFAEKISNSQFTLQCIVPVYLNKFKHPPRFIS